MDSFVTKTSESQETETEIVDESLDHDSEFSDFHEKFAYLDHHGFLKLNEILIDLISLIFFQEKIKKNP